MSENLTLTLISREKQHSVFDWMNIECGEFRVGKLRGLIDGENLTICSIIIFSEFEGLGYARATVDMLKQNFSTIIADRVRYTAVRFWEKMGFVPRGDGNHVYER